MIDDDAESQCVRMVDSLCLHLTESPFVESADAVLTIIAFRVRSSEELISMRLDGVLNGLLFEETWAYAGDGFDDGQARLIRHPVHWLIALVARRLVSGLSRSSIRDTKVNQIIAGSAMELCNSIDQLVGGTQSETGRRILSIQRRKWFAFAIGFLLFSSLQLMIEFGNPANPIARRNNNDGPLGKTGGALMLGAIAGMLPMAAYYFFSVASLNGETVERDPIGRELMARVGVDSARKLKVLGYVVSVVASVAAVAFLYFLSSRMWHLPF